jgi:hypothetical protein
LLASILDDEYSQEEQEQEQQKDQLQQQQQEEDREVTNTPQLPNHMLSVIFSGFTPR